MAARDYSLLQAATPQRLSDVYGDGPGVINAKNDIPYRQIFLQAEGATALIGWSPTLLSTAAYGLLITAGTVQSIGPFDEGGVKLSDYYMIGTVGASNRVHIFGIPL
jgi:hypothetical protein